MLYLWAMFFIIQGWISVVLPLTSFNFCGTTFDICGITFDICGITFDIFTVDSSLKSVINDLAEVLRVRSFDLILFVLNLKKQAMAC